MYKTSLYITIILNLIPFESSANNVFKYGSMHTKSIEWIHKINSVAVPKVLRKDNLNFVFMILNKAIII